MPLVQEMRRSDSLNFQNEKKVVMLRGTKKYAWADVRNSVVTMAGTRPSIRTCQRVYASYSKKLGRRVFKFARCGRKRWKATRDVEAFVVRRLRALRQRCICTSTTLQRELKKSMDIVLECSTIRRILARHGYRWRPRGQTPIVSKDVAMKRLSFARGILRLSAAQLRHKLRFSLDGVVLSMPPADPTDRANHCMHGNTHLYRKVDEAASPALAGEDPYPHQVPLARAIPMWGGISDGGVAIVTFHKAKKLNTTEWVNAVKAGRLRTAIASLAPAVGPGPLTYLCDGEPFLHTRASKIAYAADNLKVWQVPPSSPDLNPVEKFWGWLRKQLRSRDLADLSKHRPVLTKNKYKARVKAVCSSAKAHAVAKKFTADLRNVCKEVVAKKGQRSSR